MTHARRQIREAVVSVLAGLETTGPRVFTAHPFPLEPEQTPGLVVLAPEEDAAMDTMGANGLNLARTLTLFVVGYASGENVENTLDTMAAEVEAAIGADISLGRRIKEIILTGTSIDVDGDARRRAGELRMTFQARYRTGIATPETIT